MKQFTITGKGIVLATRLLFASAALTALPSCQGIGPGAGEARTQIRAVGSSTVYPFSTAVAENFMRKNPRFRPPIIESTGTGGGMKLFCGGIGSQHPDIENASRRIKPSEIAACRANGVTNIIELKVGLDGIVLAQSNRAPAFDLTPRDIYAALAATPFGRPNRATLWRDVNPALPAEQIRVYGPPPTSGTRDALTELVLEAGCAADPAMAALKKSDERRFRQICGKVREDGAYIEAGENDNLLVQKIEANPGSIGIFGYSYYEENEKQLTGLPINGVSPGYDAISSGRYLASRPLFLYIKGAHLRAVPGIREFLAEFSREASWGPGGYLARRGLIAMPAAERARYAAIARSMIPMDLASVQ